MWPIFVEFCSGSSEIRGRKKKTEEERKKEETAVKYKSTDNYVGRPKIVFWATVWGLRGNIRTLAVALVTIELFRYLLRRYKRKSVEIGVFRRRWVTLSAKFRRKGASPSNRSWYQKIRVIALTCGIKMSAVNCLVLSQSMHMMEGQTDRVNNQTKLRLPWPRGKKLSQMC